MTRRDYAVDISVNDIKIAKVIVDPHYEKKHSSSINDGLIVKLVCKLDGLAIVPEVINFPYAYFCNEIEWDGKWYRLIWLLEDSQSYIGVINAYRRS